MIILKTNATDEIKKHMMRVFNKTSVDIQLMKWRETDYLYEFLSDDDLQFVEMVGDTYLLLTLFRIKRFLDDVKQDHDCVINAEVNIQGNQFILSNYTLGKELAKYHMLTPYFEYDRQSEVSTKELIEHYVKHSGDDSMTSNKFTRTIKRYFPDCVRHRFTDDKRTRGFKGIRCITPQS